MSPRHRPSFTFAAVVVATAAVIFASAGAAGAVDSAGDLARITKSGDELAKAGSANFRGRSTQDKGGADANVVFEGKFDFGQRAGEYSTSASAFGVAGNERVRGLLLGGSVFLGLNALRNQPGFEAVPEGKTWLKVDPDVVGTSEVAQRDPSSSLDALRGARGKVARAGSDKIRGVNATHYRVTLDLAKAVTNAPEAQRDRVETSVIALGTRNIPADVWIDSKGRLRKLRLRLKGGTVVNPGSVQFEFFDLGTPVTVTQPDPNTIVDLSQILGGATTGGTG